MTTTVAIPSSSLTTTCHGPLTINAVCPTRLVLFHISLTMRPGISVIIALSICLLSASSVTLEARSEDVAYLSVCSLYFLPVPTLIYLFRKEGREGGHHMTLGKFGKMVSFSTLPQFIEPDGEQHGQRAGHTQHRQRAERTPPNIHLLKDSMPPTIRYNIPLLT